MTEREALAALVETVSNVGPFYNEAEAEAVRVAVSAARRVLAENPAAGELERLRRGDFTKEEIHNFCHNLHGKVPVEEFAAGCEAEMVKLYGRCPWTERIAALELSVTRLAGETTFRVGENPAAGGEEVMPDGADKRELAGTGPGADMTSAVADGNASPSTKGAGESPGAGQPPPSSREPWAYRCRHDDSWIGPPCSTWLEAQGLIAEFAAEGYEGVTVEELYPASPERDRVVEAARKVLPPLADQLGITAALAALAARRRS